eukprot:CAMPEP_0181294494 /NCGR_PEP_ID=MMETSP1101-20121128/3635_1 /TAXON_ID=46948 /ORGANISM="Rhodomonas abbreviata, Strain Caron Lab Isolate" /LENGTH=224 /DNA_ID=CAMNT_0023399165 /DNA_START=87 /DNA_END=758 /DNA_ORIENTATION=+
MTGGLPPPESVTIRSRIPSDYHLLAQYHKYHPWIPNSDQIRPNPEIKAAKLKTIQDIEATYRSSTDYILSSVFRFPTIFDRYNNKMKIAGVSDAETFSSWSDQVLHTLFTNNPSIKPLQFAPNKFPYCLSGGGHHYVMWYSTNRLLKGDSEINHDITRCIKKDMQARGQKGKDFDFAWYVNPKMTVPQLAHVQVFWAVLDGEGGAVQGGGGGREAAAGAAAGAG